MVIMMHNCGIQVVHVVIMMRTCGIQVVHVVTDSAQQSAAVEASKGSGSRDPSNGTELTHSSSSKQLPGKDGPGSTGKQQHGMSSAGGAAHMQV
jgi:hypothetical protein